MSRGFSSIGLVRTKSAPNIGGALRAATCYGASFVALENPRAQRSYAADTPNTPAKLPVVRCEALSEVVPMGAIPVAVDLVDGATSLINFQHPACAFYVFGPEDGTLGARILDWCPIKVMVPTKVCMNLAATVNVVLYDRMAKQVAS